MTATTMNARTEAKIEALLALINHAKTSEDERDAARRALKRIYDAHEMHRKDADTPEYSRLYNPGAWQGSKYESASRLTLTEIAKLIRADIKMAQKIGRKVTDSKAIAVRDAIADAPAQIKYSVRTEYYSGGGSIDVVIKNIPETWGWTMQPDEFGNLQPVATPAMAELYAAVDAIHRSYNYGNSDGMVDYFERRYWGHVATSPRVRIPRN
jgi:hypothetical protein